MELEACKAYQYFNATLKERTEAYIRTGVAVLDNSFESGPGANGWRSVNKEYRSRIAGLHGGMFGKYLRKIAAEMDIRFTQVQINNYNKWMANLTISSRLDVDTLLTPIRIFDCGEFRWNEAKEGVYFKPPAKTVSEIIFVGDVGRGALESWLHLVEHDKEMRAAIWKKIKRRSK